MPERFPGFFCVGHTRSHTTSCVFFLANMVNMDIVFFLVFFCKKTFF